ncbi:kinetochore scaffold 1 [Neoarius graeffei]|uniref:kinetochore scaffold 1 n=1 Tax=Neoarius graeffei TaxID=443677 RepID=UPI00298BE913|nr:kinetochore scaffold 1 [Neoarius graeffei]
MKRSGAILEQLGTVLASQAVECKSSTSLMDLDTGNLVDGHKMAELARHQIAETKTDHKSCTPSSSNNMNEYTSLNLTVKNVDSSEEDCNMEITRAFTVPLEGQCCIAFSQEEMTREIVATTPVTTEQKIFQEMDHTLPVNNKTGSSAKEDNDPSLFESDTDALKKDRSSSVKSRRRSLADLQVKLQSISQHINDPDGLLAGSVTAPLVSFTVASPIESPSERHGSLQPFKETQPLEEKINLAHKEGATPFNLKNSLMARLSVGGIVPKFPPRTRSSPNQTEPKSPNDLQGPQLQTCFSVDVQNVRYETDLFDEVLPDEDLSGTLVSYLSKSKEQEVTGVHLNDDAIEYDRMESVMAVNQSEKMPPEVKDAAVDTKDTNEKPWDSNYAAQNAPTHVVKVIDNANSSSNSTLTKCDGISELTLRNSQLDSQIEGTMDHEFDFYKKLEEGSLTVNELLTYFGAKFVIHRSRPSALPDNFRAAQTYTMEDLLREKYIHRPQQKVYETDCQNLSEMSEGFKTQMADQDKPLRSINETLLQDVSSFSKEQLQSFGAKLKERRVYFRKRSKALSHKMKENLYSELLKTTKEAKQSLMSQVKETNEMLKDLDGCINDLESELFGMNNIVMGDAHSFISLQPVLKAKQEQLDALNSEVTEKEKQICKLELQAQSLEDTWNKVQDEIKEFERRTTNLNSLNEWRFNPGDKDKVYFNFLHDTVQLEVKHKKDTGNKCMQDEREVDVHTSFTFLLNAESSQPSAIMIHKLLKENINSQAKWMQKDLTAQHVPMLLHDVSVVVSRLRLLGEEIHRLKKWGGLRLGILHITCVDTLVEVMFSSIRAFVKFELSLAVTPDYPFRPLQLQEFQNHIGDTRLEQIRDIVSSVRPGKNYLTRVMKKIHSHLLG